ncbi:MAG: TetR/AcrR family transcriptional regulator, partial [Planctomycetota bacterium]|nr:TetR/AcrR family transcriptional regulator [Planctomycetota bacterium]
ARAVLRRVAEPFATDNLAPLAESAAPASRIRKSAARLRDFYADGRKSCLLDTMSLGLGAADLAAETRAAMAGWIDAFAAVAREAGLSPAAARRRAEDAVAQLEGALVVARVAGDTRVFQRVIDSLPSTLTAA